MRGDWRFKFNELAALDFFVNCEYVIEYDNAAVFSDVINVYKVPIKYSANNIVFNGNYRELVHCKKIMNVTERKFLRVLKRYGFKFNRDKYNKIIYGEQK